MHEYEQQEQKEYGHDTHAQDILENEQIELDWVFKFSLIQDIVRVGAGRGRGEGWHARKASTRTST